MLTTSGAIRPDLRPGAVSQVKAAEAAAPKTKTQLLNEEKDELRAQYELTLQRAKIAKLEADYNNLVLENKFSGELHHQMSTMNWGNMTQFNEQLDLAREWERRLMLPVPQKMGIPTEDFRKKMYEKNSDGDWEEFGDRAVEYKWATSVVDRIEETGLVKNPDYESPAMAKRSALDENTDEKGQRCMALPRLQPFDFYFSYNPDKYYR